MKNIPTKRRKPTAGSRIIETLREAVDWAEGKDVSVHVTTVEVPTVDVPGRSLRWSGGATDSAS